MIDRRFWAGASVVILSLLGVFGVGEETLARIRELAGDDGAAIALLMETLVPLDHLVASCNESHRFVD